MKLADDFQKNIVNDLVEKSYNNSNFKKEFISNPKKLIESEYNVKVHDDIKLVVEDQSDVSTVYFNIPRKVDIDALELTEEQLERVSGGSSGWCFAGGAIAGGAIYDFVDGMIEGFCDNK